ncbi:MAG: hypothetical protein IT318_00230 [Anaerolineales bacterium]|nr:hypothetical protein [Anaerolineales bacterium]
MSAEPIVIGAYDPRWPPLFAAERVALQAALGPRAGHALDARSASRP